MAEKKWIISEMPPQTFLAEHPELPPIVARLLWNRNIKTQKEIDEFLNTNYSEDLHDPFLFKDMNKAVDIIFECIKNKKKIVVHGDYDADGVCASVIIISTLKKLGAEGTEVFLPHRQTDGYGLNVNTVKLLHEKGASLIITCDCGISNTEEIILAKKLGMMVIVTDHHAMPAVFPPADAIIHPLVPGETYPDKTLAGGGVAFKLVQALLRHHKQLMETSGVGAHSCAPLPNGETHEQAEKWLLDMVAISTIGDMVPLTGESRTLVRYGLTVMNKTKNLGLKKLLIEAGIADDTGRPKRGAFDTHSVGFQIAPRINAAGRMDHANVACALLLSTDEAEATQLAKQLNQNNVDRQKLTEKIVLEARYQITEEKQENNPILFAYKPEWTAGIFGLIAGRIKDEFGKPTLIMGEVKGEVAGSGRSVAGFNLIEVLKTVPEFFHKFGGHPMACGFSLKTDTDFDEFKKIMLEMAKAGTNDLDLSPQIAIDAEVDLDEVNWKLYELLEKFEPFGVANEEPLYAARSLTVAKVNPVGTDGKHLQLMVKHNSTLIKKTIAFGFGDPERHPANWKELKPGDKIDLAFSVGVNEWNGNRELQLQVEDIKKSVA